MRITKLLAANLAAVLCKTKAEELLQSNKELNMLAYQFYINILPQDILTLYSKYKGYIKTCSGIKPYGFGFSSESISFGNSANSLPTNDGHGYRTVELPEKESNVLRTAYDKTKKLKSDYDKLYTDVEAVMFNLHTRKNVLEQFPELLTVLPEQSTSTALVVNLSDLKNRLK